MDSTSINHVNYCTMHSDFLFVVTALIINEARGNASIFHPTPDTPCDVTITSLSELLDILQRPLTIYKRT